ncbi:hypothetical protein LJ656_32335 [Paraburkholderia sp. MMS20-SJTR3]|uniref:Uncharacterized protein n=1 Tax=Paraburkholderia sejongensis TaxID=2886946 RepID=A0ABS8K521_9BURK|nr:hypothetical protein [Paraburkholderia sp. MMS20-SJTR3]MCC8397264.1 hypothetical protein [Paraburkholderia sp. MMS20-SJTR3]
MPKQFLMKATRSPMSFLAVCFALWLAAHSFFAALFVGFLAIPWIRTAIRDALKDERETSDTTPASSTTAKPQAEAVATAAVTPIKRQYAKSPVVVPLKTGTDE